MSGERTMEQQDPLADSGLIDPGPRSASAYLRVDERAARAALRDSTPAPITKGRK